MFKITENKGFHMTFENGVTISVQFGFGNYCENKLDYKIMDYLINCIPKNVESVDAEIMIWDGNDKVITDKIFDDDVQGYLSPNDVLKAMVWASEYKY